MDWDQRARGIAEVHFDDDFESRRGVEPLDSGLAIGDSFYIFNNCPPRRGMIEREQELNRIREEAAKLGIRELGYGEYPNQGVDEGYSYVIIFAGGDHQRKQVEEILRS